MRHSGASEVLLSLQQLDGALRLTVRDNGNGLSNGSAEPGSGIKGMSERALHVGGRLTIASTPEAGTEVRLDIPIPEAVQCRSR